MADKRRILLRIAGCPYCIRAEQALDNAGVTYEKIEVSPSDRSVVQLLSGQPTVPVLVEVVGCKDQDDDIIAYIEELRASSEAQR
jgi:glutaredoxin